MIQKTWLLVLKYQSYHNFITKMLLTSDSLDDPISDGGPVSGTEAASSSASGYKKTTTQKVRLIKQQKCKSHMVKALPQYFQENCIINFY